MVEPVTVFLVSVACLLVAGAAARPLSERTGVPEALWLVAVGALLRATGLASADTITALAPFFAALALVIVLFEAGRDLRFRAGLAHGGRARRLALAGAGLAIPAVMLLSMALSGLNLLPTWSWTHGLMLGALLLCTAPEVFAPALRQEGAPAAVVSTLEREAALRGGLAIAITATCIDLLSLKVGEGEALAAIAAGFGLGLAFGAFAGLLWIATIRRVGPLRSVYPYTLAGLLGLYVVTDGLGGIGALAVLVFGAVVTNAGTLVAVLFRPRGAQAEGDAADEDFTQALDDHARTVEIVRALLFLFIGLGLGPPWGLLLFGVALGLVLVVTRLLAARLVLRGLPEREHALLAVGWPRGMVVAGLAALPHAAAVPGTEHLTTLVFSAVATTCVAFAVARAHGHAAARGSVLQAAGPKEAAPKEAAPKDMSVGPGKKTAERTEIRPPAAEEVAPAAPPRRTLERTEIRVPTVEEVLAPAAPASASGARAVARVVPAAEAPGAEVAAAAEAIAGDAAAVGSGMFGEATLPESTTPPVGATNTAPPIGSGMFGEETLPTGESTPLVWRPEPTTAAVDVRAMFAAPTAATGPAEQVPPTLAEWAGASGQTDDVKKG